MIRLSLQPARTLNASRNLLPGRQPFARVLRHSSTWRSSTYHSSTWYAIVAAGGVLLAGAHASAATYQVTTTADFGRGSLREAIVSANANRGPDRIEFALKGASRTIVLVKALPAITELITIDGYTQLGSSVATATGPAFMGVTIDASNADIGLEVRTSGSTIRGLAILGTRALVISGDNNVVQGNHLGTDAAGTLLASGIGGVTVDGTGNVIGGSKPEDRNVIAGYYGVIVASGGANRIEGNFIGIDAEGNPGFGEDHGIQIDLSDDNLLIDNIVSDYFVGMEVWGDHNIIQGNRIGTDPEGLGAIPNSLGINIEGGDENLIGGTAEGEGNLISGNPVGAIQFESGEDGTAVGNILVGNTIGLDVTGTVPIPNAGPTLAAIWVNGAEDTTIGGTVPGAMNVISGNDGDGIRIYSGAAGTRVLGNRIGTDSLGIRVLGNSGHGVRIDGNDNWVGDGSGPWARNVIAHNGGDGVWVEGGTGNPILENLIFKNGGLGIDLGPDGRSGEDPAPDTDSGANDAQTPPVLTVAVTNAVDTPVQWSLASTPSTEMRVDFYWSVTCDPTGFGEGFIHLGTQVVTTNPSGRVSRTFNAQALPVDTVITATATPLIAGVPTSTSEFSECKVVTP
jgi:hypothetical protein